MRRAIAIWRASLDEERRLPRVDRNREEREFLPAALEVLETPASPAGRSAATLIDHMVPPFRKGGLYAELAELKRQAGVARLPVPHYLRQRVLRRGLRISDPRRLGAEEFREVRRLAVNINQAVHALHQGRPFSPSAERALQRLHELLEALLPGDYR